MLFQINLFGFISGKEKLEHYELGFEWCQEQKNKLEKKYKAKFIKSKNSFTIDLNKVYDNPDIIKEWNNSFCELKKLDLPDFSF